VIACSFGKDSPVTLALALRAMDELQREGIRFLSFTFSPVILGSLQSAAP